MADFLFVESNTTGTGWLFFDAARRRGLRPVLVSADPARYRVVPDAVIKVDTVDCAALLASASTHGKGQPIAGVWSSSEYYVCQAALIARHLGLPGPDPRAVLTARNKAVQRTTLAAAGVDQWPSIVAATADEAIRAAERLGYPVVVKPVAGSGSVGVRLCASASEVRMHAEHVAEVVLSAIERDRRMLVESPVPGDQFSVELFGETVIGITRQHYGPLPYYVAIGHDFPAQLSRKVRDRIAQFALQTCAALGLTWGPLHVELRWDALTDQIHLIEANPRLAGGNVPELIRHATGIDLVAATVAAALGDTPRVAATQGHAAALRFILANGTTFGQTPSLPARHANPLIRDVKLYRTRGDRLDRVGDFHDRIGHVIAAGEDAHAVQFAAQSAVDNISRQLLSIAA